MDKAKVKNIATASWHDFTTKRVMVSASSLTYSTMLAIVPILAVVFGIARGFGYSMHIEEWFRSTLASQPETGETIIGFVNSYLANTQKGIFLGIGLVFMLWTVLMLISNIEQTFNDIWQVRKQRTLFRTFTDYISMLFMVPIFIVLSSGINIWIAAINSTVEGVVVVGGLVKFCVELAPYLLVATIFTLLYMFMPNTNVRFRYAVGPGIVAGFSFQLFQMIYINSQIWISSYNAIYGSFAILPFFMLWMQISWTICLVGAEASYMIQNSEDFSDTHRFDTISHNARIRISTAIVNLICKRFDEGGTAYTAIELKEKVGISMRLLSTLLYDLQRIHVVTEIYFDEKGENASYQPAESPANLTEAELEKRLNELGYSPIIKV